MDTTATLPDQLNRREREILSRLSGGLSDQQIADDLFLSLNTVKWYNRQIYGKLGVKSRTQAIRHAKGIGLLSEPVPVSTAAPRHNLPTPSTPFVGREGEVAELKGLLRAHRLVTLTGTGGIGKTRLALRLAAAVADEFADGAFFVDLAPLADHALVAKAIATALGVMESPNEAVADTLKRVMVPREMLLVLDNFEHVIEAAPLVSELLAASPRCRILVTSREALRLAAEQGYPVPPLSLPSPGDPSARGVSESEAGALFVQRARLTLPHFAVNDGNAAAIAQICARLDGLPLALELAAAQTKLLPPWALLARLSGTSKELPWHALAGGTRDAPPRLRTMRASLEWSYNLLLEDEKKLFARLSVFRGGFSLEAVEAVCGEGLGVDVFDGLAALVDKSLVLQRETPAGEPRFVLLEIVHEYARERLEDSGEAAAMRERLAGYFVELAERAEPQLRLAGYDYWCDRFELELDNIRAVLEWALDGGNLTPGVRLAGALGLYWYGRGHHVEGIRWTRQLLARLSESPAVYHPAFLFAAGHMAWMYDLEEAQRLFVRALDTALELGNQQQIAWSLTFLGYSRLQEPTKALAIAEDGLARFRALGHKPGIAQALNMVGEIARLRGDDGQARAAYKEGLAVCQETGEVRRSCYLYNSLAYIAQHEGDHERALELGRQVLLLARRRNDRHEMAQALMGFAGSLGVLGQARRAARLLGTGEAVLERIGAFSQPSDQPEHERIVAAIRTQLGDAEFEAARAEGRRLPLEAAMADALEKPD
ncbi:MAG: LuxR C-terminal-related transcriptional regulator [Chloroflexota bacterium]